LRLEEEMCLEAVRRINSRGGCAPHLAISFDAHLFSIDTSRAPRLRFSRCLSHNPCSQRSLWQVGHALLTSVASMETARALEIRHDREYQGRTFRVGESILVDEVLIDTHPTGHTIGSSAFSWLTETGERVAGDRRCQGLPASPQKRFSGHGGHLRRPL